MLADCIGKRTGIEVYDTIIQISEIHRTGTDEWSRLIFPSEFSGTVIVGRKYLIVDDAFTSGGTFNELCIFIENKADASRKLRLFLWRDMAWY